MFRVVPDQLRVSAGWVRCGQCDEIFDASAHFVNNTPPARPVGGDTAADQRAAEPSEPAQTAQPEPASLPEAPPSSGFPPNFPSDFREVDLNLEEVLTEWDSAAEPAPEYREAILDGDALCEAILTPDRVESLRDFEETESAALATVELPVEGVSFLSKDGESTKRSRPAWRWLLAVVGLFLFLGLFSQVAYRERNRLAAWEPRLAPWLEQVCNVLSCSVDPVRKIESISVDGATFAKLRGDTYRLSFSLKSSSTTPVAFPAVELTLTDMLDRPILRRVLLASDIGPTDAVLAAGAEWPASIDIAVQSTALPERVAGYRLVAFYP
jgi:predicted Zn finger-like uncharacterized protein